jgi:hypothetical protein
MLRLLFLDPNNSNKISLASPFRTKSSFAGVCLHSWLCNSPFSGGGELLDDSLASDSKSWAFHVIVFSCSAPDPIAVPCCDGNEMVKIQLPEA